jgi:hypothetical protein
MQVLRTIVVRPCNLNFRAFEYHGRISSVPAVQHPNQSTGHSAGKLLSRPAQRHMPHESPLPETLVGQSATAREGAQLPMATTVTVQHQAHACWPSSLQALLLHMASTCLTPPDVQHHVHKLLLQQHAQSGHSHLACSQAAPGDTDIQSSVCAPARFQCCSSSVVTTVLLQQLHTCGNHATILPACCHSHSVTDTQTNVKAAAPAPPPASVTTTSLPALPTALRTPYQATRLPAACAQPQLACVVLGAAPVAVTFYPGRRVVARVVGPRPSCKLAPSHSPCCHSTSQPQAQAGYG